MNPHRRMDRLLAESERRYRLLAENMSAVIWTCDLEQRPTYVTFMNNPRSRAG